MGINYREPFNKGATTPREEMANFQRVCMIERFMDKRVSCRKFDLQAKKDGGGFSFSFSSSSDSSSGGGQLPDEISFTGGSVRRPKQIRTGGFVHGHQKEKSRDCFERRLLADRSEPEPEPEPKPKHEGGFLKTKSRTLKIYADLKKVKQPISPGRKLAAFLNSLFTTSAGSSKKHKADQSPSSKSANTSTCSSTSSFSRSFLSKPPPSTGKFSTVANSSVKFFPIVDEDRRKASDRENKPIFNTTLYSELVKNKNGSNSIKSSNDEELMEHVMEYNRRVEDAAIDFLRKTHFTNRVFDQESEEDDDMESCASSDLFELDNLSTIGVERYREELPVYETTSADAKRVITN